MHIRWRASHLKNTPALIIATGLGSGYSPIAPGTAGSIVAIPFIWLLSCTGPVVYAIAAVAVFGLGVWSAGVAEGYYGQKDSSRITVDEISGMLVAMFLIPATPAMLAAGFLLFRIFDITKPFPAGLADREVGGGLGVMLDDVVAGVYANICLHVIRSVGL